MTYCEGELCRKYRLPQTLVFIDLENIHKRILETEFYPALQRVCDSQIKWLLKLGWTPPEKPKIC